MIPVRSRTAFRICQILFLVSTTAIAQNTINVPADQSTIQGAINVAASGDTVLVAPGTYVENINFSGKAITLTSSGGAASTIIDGNAAGSVVTFNQGESNSAVLNGFTIQNGHAYFGAGININGASPKITNNVITNNGGISGIGIDVENGSPTIQGNTVTNNVQNMGTGGGGAIYISASASTPSNVSIIGNVITNNHLDGGSSGGGISLNYFASVLVQNNYIAGNSAYNGGGGIHAQSNGTITIVDNIIIHNSSGSGGDGGGFDDWNNGPLSFLNNTLYGNSSNLNGTSEIAIVPYYVLNSTFMNNIVYATSGSAVSCSTINALTASDNIVFSVGTATNGSCPAFNVSNGNLAADPLLKDPVNGDFHLQAGSPAIDAGDITSPALPAQDYSGVARLGDDSGQCNFVIDLGVYESHPAAPGSVSLSSASLSFPDTGVGSTSAPQPLVLTGTGQGCFRITGFNVSGNFAQTNSCGAGLPAGQSCTAQVTFAPTAAGPRSGSLAIRMNTNTGTPPNPVMLSGQGLAPHGRALPSALSFAGLNINTSSSPQTITLTSDGAATLTVNAVTVTGDFTQTNNCSGPMAPGASCSIQVTFTPTANGQLYGTLSIASNSLPAVPNVSLTGQGLGPQGSFSPASLTFPGQQVVNTTSAAQNIVLTNIGGQLLTIASLSITGDYVQTNDCPGTLAQGASCSVQVTFTPTANGQRYGTLSIVSNSTPAVPNVSLIGSGQGPQGLLSLAIMTFNALEVVNTTSAPQNLVLTNIGGQPLHVTSFNITGDYAQTNNCQAPLAPNAACVIQVTFTPTIAGARQGTLSISSDSAPAIPTLLINGNGVAPFASVTPASLSFGSQPIYTTSAPQAITIANTASVPLTISQIGTAAPFQQSNNCGTSVAPGASCVVSVTYQPTARQASAGSLVISSNVSGGTNTVALSGNGIGPAGTVNPTSLTFTQQVVGTTSSPQSFTLSSTGETALSIQSISVSAPFAQTNNCPASLAPGASCSVQVVFSPAAKGIILSGVVVNVPWPATSPIVNLSGTSVAPQISVSPSALNFATQAAGTVSGAQLVQIFNAGNGPLTIANISTSSPFQQTNNCSAPVPGGGTCTINVTFAPSTSTSSNGYLTFTQNDSSAPSPFQVSLSGTGSPPPAVATVSPMSLTFASQLVGTTTPAQSVTLSNTGGSALSISSITVPAPFAQTNNCGSSLAAGATCTINVTFTPTARGAASANLAVNVLAPATSQTVVVSGTGVAPVMALSPASLTFSSQLVGTTSAAQAVTVSNTGDAALSLNLIQVLAPFAQNNNCGSSLAAGATCTINVTFTPTSLGAASGTLALYAPGTSQTVALSGTGLAPVATFSPASFTFATQRVGTTSPQQLVTLSNTGNSVLTISSIATVGAIVFSETNNCPATLAPGSSCAIYVTFRPVQSGNYYGDVDVFDDSGAVSGTEQRVLLTGPGGASTATLSPTSLAFGTAKVGTSTAPAAVAISNSGTMALNISSIAASGDFSQSNNCGTSVAPGGNCVVNVFFTPTATGARNGTLTISSDAQNGNVQTASLSGTGALPAANLSPASLTFATIPVGTQSGSSAVTLTNTGAVPMNISSIATSGDFTQSNNCPTALAASATCTINVTFAPTAAGTRTGLLTIADDASGGSQTVALSGSATDFTVTISPTSSSLNPGQHVSYNPTIHPLGGAYNQTVSLTCSGMPAGATCTVTPTSVVLGGSSQSAKVNITTSSGTPAGTYTLVVTGVANGVARSGMATLIVK